MTFSELDVSLKVSHDECFRVKFEQDYKLMKFFFLIYLPSNFFSYPPSLNSNLLFTRIVVILCEICSKNRRRPGTNVYLNFPAAVD